MTQTKSTRVFLLSLAVLAVTLGTGCRRNQTTASRSARMDHSRPGTSSGAHTGPTSGADYSQMSMGPASAQPVAGDHSAMGHGPGPTPRTAEPRSAIAQPGAPASTLMQDALDAPAPTAIEEATRAESAAASGHDMSHGTYRQVDAGRPEVAKTSPAAAHQQQSAAAEAEHSKPNAPASPSDHSGHGSPPAVRPPAPSPPPAAADPHAGHQAPATPRPTPSPSPRQNR